MWHIYTYANSPSIWNTAEAANKENWRDISLISAFRSSYIKPYPVQNAVPKVHFLPQLFSRKESRWHGTSQDLRSNSYASWMEPIISCNMPKERLIRDLNEPQNSPVHATGLFSASRINVFGGLSNWCTFYSGLMLLLQSKQTSQPPLP